MHLRHSVGIGAIALVLLAAPAVADVGPCQVFPPTNWFRADISGLPKHAQSDAWLSRMSPGKTLRAGFGGADRGIPWITVTNAEPPANFTFKYPAQSDAGPYPYPNSIPIEGGGDNTAASTGRRRAIVINTDTCVLSETSRSRRTGSSNWTADIGALWDLNSYALRTNGWASASSGGLPVFPLLARLDEVMSGEVDHAIGFTFQRPASRYVWPARHQAGAALGQDFPPMGARFRLKPSFDTSGYSGATLVVLTAMKKHGIVLVDKGFDWHILGELNVGWSSATGLLDNLKTISVSEFEAVDTSSLMVDPNSSQVPP